MYDKAAQYPSRNHPPLSIRHRNDGNLTNFFKIMKNFLKNPLFRKTNKEKEPSVTTFCWGRLSYFRLQNHFQEIFSFFARITSNRPSPTRISACSAVISLLTPRGKLL